MGTEHHAIALSEIEARVIERLQIYDRMTDEEFFDLCDTNLGLFRQVSGRLQDEGILNHHIRVTRNRPNNSWSLNEAYKKQKLSTSNVNGVTTVYLWKPTPKETYPTTAKEIAKLLQD